MCRRKYPDPASVVAEIKRRAEAGLPLYGNAVNRGEFRDMALYRWGHKYFWTWKAAVEAADIDYDEVRYVPPRRFPDKASVVAEIKRRAEAGQPLNASIVKKLDGAVLCKYAIEYFGSWDALLAAAGIPLEEVHSKPVRCYPDPDSVIAEIKRRAEADKPLNGRAVLKGEQREAGLYNRGREYFGTWSAALEGAGFNPREIHKSGFKKYPGKRAVVKELRRRHAAGLSSHYKEVYYGEHRDKTLHREALHHYGSWHGALNAAGVEIWRKPRDRRKREGSLDADEAKGPTIPQLLIFDLDGTLIDSRADLAASINHMRGQFGLDVLPVETVSGYVGDGVRKLVERALQGATVDLEEALRINVDYYQSHSTDRTYLYEGVAEGLPALVAAGHQLALLTNKPGDPSRTILQHFGIAHYFGSIIGGGDVARLKPSPDGIFQCLKTTGMTAARAWMIGDHYTDLSVAHNAGIKSAFVRYGFGEERGFEPAAYFASFPELVGYFV